MALTLRHSRSFGLNILKAKSLHIFFTTVYLYLSSANPTYAAGDPFDDSVGYRVFLFLLITALLAPGGYLVLFGLGRGIRKLARRDGEPAPPLPRHISHVLALIAGQAGILLLVCLYILLSLEASRSVIVALCIFVAFCMGFIVPGKIYTAPLAVLLFVSGILLAVFIAGEHPVISDGYFWGGISMLCFFAVCLVLFKSGKLIRSILSNRKQRL